MKCGSQVIKSSVSYSQHVHTCPQSSETESVKNTLFEQLFQELPNIFVSRDIKSVSELYGQRLCIMIIYEYAHIITPDDL
jgi:hypothetical protein